VVATPRSEGLYGRDPLLELLDRGLGARWTAAALTEFRVDLSVWQSGPVMVGPHQPVQLPTQGDPALPGRYTIRLRTPAPGVTTSRLDTGYYSRTVEVPEV